MCALAAFDEAFHCLEVAVSVQVVWFQVAGLRPLIPAVDCDELVLLRMPVQVIFCHMERLFEEFRGVFLADVAYEFSESWIVVPSN